MSCQRWQDKSGVRSRCLCAVFFKMDCPAACTYQPKCSNMNPYALCSTNLMHSELKGRLKQNNNNKKRVFKD